MAFSSSEVLKECWPRFTGALVRWGSALFFGATIEGLGLAPALFVTTFVAALACRGVSPLKALAISVGLTVLCLGIFVGLLQLRLPLLGDWLGG